MSSRKLRIAMVGTRGVPASHGGFETCVEEIGWRLAASGHEIIVYSKPSGGRATVHRGMRTVSVPRLPLPGVASLAATLLSIIHSLFLRCDVHMVFDNANSPLLLLYRLFARRFALNTDGLGWQRDKWGWFAKRYYRWTERVAARVCPHIVTDSRAMHDYYLREYGAESTVIEYGAAMPSLDDSGTTDEVLRELGLEPRKYFLQVTRLEPENNPMLTIRAFCTCPCEHRLVLVGSAPRPTKYSREMQRLASADPRIAMPGPIYDQYRLAAIWRNCLAYVHGNQTGGTNPALLQAMAAGRPVIARDCIFNREVLGENGLFYERDHNDLAARMREVMASTAVYETTAARAQKRVEEYYTWDRVATLYGQLFRQMCGAHPRDTD